MNQEHISKQFDADLEGLRTRVLAMGGLVEQQVIAPWKASTPATSR
jgi:phosphate transport system protein